METHEWRRNGRRRSREHSWGDVTNEQRRRPRHGWATPDSQGTLQVLALLSISCSLATLNGCARKSEPGPPLARRLTSTADNLRTGWYPNQPELDPVIVAGPSFGRLWATALPLASDEQVFAQPLVKGNTVFLATESNDIYAIDAQSGAVLAARALGTPVRAADLGCADLGPGIGITGTPVIDDDTNTAYFFSKRYLTDQSTTQGNVGWFMHGVDVDTLAERPGFPVTIGGQASNDPSTTFDPYFQHQRTALLLMNGVVYAGFGSHCDGGSWRGWVIGVGIDGHVKSLFATMVGNDIGGGIWGSGGGLVSDGPGRILFTTGNGSDASETPQATPGLQLTESAVRLQVQGDGTMVPVDFFTPANRSMLETNDRDYGAGGPVALPSETFGTAAYPDLLVTGGKSGTVYILDRNHLGGYKQGPGTGDAVVAVIDTGVGGLWTRAGVWPGDGGYIYLVPNASGMQAYRYGLTNAGLPTFARAGITQATFGFSSGAPIVTSDGTSAGTGVVWVVNATGSYGIGTLQAYAAVPDAAGEMTKLYEDTFGSAAKFAPPGVGAGRLYVGSADGHLVAYGSPVNSGVTVAPTQFGVVPIGSSKTVDVVITARQAVTVTQLSTSAAPFSVGTPSIPLPASLTAGETLTVPVTFTPSASTLFAASLTVDTSTGPVAGSMRGTGQPTGPSLRVSSTIANFGGIVVGTTTSINVTLSNVGAQALTWTAFDQPAAPFSLGGLPGVGEVLAAGASVTITATFAPVANGTFGGSFTVESDGGNATVLMSGSAGDPQRLLITPQALSFDTEVGVPRNLGFTLTNAGGAPLTITKSKPPVMGAFSVSPPLDEGSVIPPGQSVFEVVTFAPATTGTFADQWIITGNDGSGVQTVALTGVAHVAGDGLAATYFDMPDLTGNTVTRIDPQIDFDWAGAAPADGIGANGFSATWTGQVLPNTTEVYTFHAESDDGVRLWINGDLVIDQWDSHASSEATASLALVAGQAVDLRMEYWQGWGEAVARLSWSAPSLLKQVIPQVQLFSRGGASSGAGGTPGTGSGGASGTGGDGGGSGSGLQATYFDQQDLSGNTVTRVDPSVAFDWSGTSPDPLIPTVAFSARWTGKVKAPTSDTYTISASADDGVRVWVAGNLVIDGWQDQSLTTFQSPPLALVAGELYDIKVEYYQGWGGAIMSLSWASSSTPAQIIPPQVLFH
jgi:hypothetical protein